MKRNIPNILTGLNAVSGTMSVLSALNGELMTAAVWILVGMGFDFFDGMVARLLHVKSELGRELDSLADIVSFGVAPAVLVYILLQDQLASTESNFANAVFPFVPLLIPFFSAFRLAKFNLDARQATSFLGLPVPAHALFWVGVVIGREFAPDTYEFLFGNGGWTSVVCVVLLSLALVSELPMFSLKVTGFSWRENRTRYVYLICILIYFLLLGWAAVMAIIPLYLLFCGCIEFVDAMKGRESSSNAQ